MSQHPTNEQLTRFLEEKLEEGERGQIEEHLETCEECGARLEMLGQTLGPMRGVLEPSSSGSMDEERIVPGSTIDRYRLLYRLGAGGMGEVWVAEQSEPVKRQVALKFIKVGLGTREISTRFEAERQALALMSHANIARILDAGSTRSQQPYFVMELVAGQPLIAFCDANRLSVVDRLKIFEQICSGVQHAHQKGVIHRDLKPGNILVGYEDGVAVPKIIDFGLAKALEAKSRLTDRTLSTEYGQLLGTLQYMSPEQAGMDSQDVDTRADIYALGVILYQLLTGYTPLDEDKLRGESILKILEAIREQEAIKPSDRVGHGGGREMAAISEHRRVDSLRLKRILAGDLDWIVMKALEKDRNRRYESAAGLGADIGRYLRGEPVEARPPSVRYRVSKFIRKNRVGVTAVVLVFVSLIGGVVGTSMATLRAWDAERLAQGRYLEAEEARQKEAMQKRLAESRREEAERNMAFARRSNEVLSSVFVGIDPRGEYNTVAELRNALRDNLIAANGQVEGLGIGDPLEVAQMQANLGEALLGLGQSDDAKTLYEKVVETRTRILGEDHSETLVGVMGHAMAHQNLGGYEVAIPMLERAFARLAMHLGEDDRLTLHCGSQLGLCYWGAGQSRLAIERLEPTLDRQKAKLGQRDSDTLNSMLYLASAYSLAGRLDESLKLQADTMELMKAEFGVESNRTLLCMNNLAAVYRENGRHLEAIGLWEEVLPVQRQRLGNDHPRTLQVMHNLGVSYVDIMEVEKAMPLVQEALKRRRLVLGADHPSTLATMNGLADLEVVRANYGEALSWYEQVVEHRKRELGEEHIDTQISMAGMAKCLYSQGEIEKAIGIWTRLSEVQPETIGEEHPRALMVMNNLGAAYHATGDIVKAVEIWERILPMMEKKNGIQNADTIATMQNLGAGYISFGRLGDALPLMTRSLELIQASLGESNPETINYRHNLGICYRRLGETGKAVPLAEEAFELAVQHLGSEHPSTLHYGATLGVYLLDVERAEEGVELLERAYRNVEKYSRLNWVKAKLSAAYVQVGRVEAHRLIASELEETARTNLVAGSIELADELEKTASQYLSLKQFEEAGRLYREVLELRRGHDAGHWKMYQAMSAGGASMMEIARSRRKDEAVDGSLSEVEEWLVAGYEGLERQRSEIPMESRGGIGVALDRLIEFYRWTGQAEKERGFRAIREKPSEVAK